MIQSVDVTRDKSKANEGKPVNVRVCACGCNNKDRNLSVWLHNIRHFYRKSIFECMSKKSIKAWLVCTHHIFCPCPFYPDSSSPDGYKKENLCKKYRKIDCISFILLLLLLLFSPYVIWWIELGPRNCEGNHVSIINNVVLCVSCMPWHTGIVCDAIPIFEYQCMPIGLSEKTEFQIPTIPLDIYQDTWMIAFHR